MAVDDDIIRKNPAKFSISDYGRQAEERISLNSFTTRKKCWKFVKNKSSIQTPTIQCSESC